MPLTDRCQICHRPFTLEDRKDGRLGPRIIVRKDLGHVHSYCSGLYPHTATFTLVVKPDPYIGMSVQ